MAFDTLTYAKKLQEAGVPPQQAEAHAGALQELVEGNVATKQDLREMEARLEARMATLEVKMAGMETRLLVRLGAITIGGITILGVLMKLL